MTQEEWERRLAQSVQNDKVLAPAMTASEAAADHALGMAFRFPFPEDSWDRMLRETEPSQNIEDRRNESPYNWRNLLHMLRL